MYTLTAYNHAECQQFTIERKEKNTATKTKAELFPGDAVFKALPHHTY